LDPVITYIVNKRLAPMMTQMFYTLKLIVDNKPSNIIDIDFVFKPYDLNFNSIWLPEKLNFKIFELRKVASDFSRIYFEGNSTIYELDTSPFVIFETLEPLHYFFNFGMSSKRIESLFIYNMVDYFNFG